MLEPEENKPPVADVVPSTEAVINVPVASSELKQAIELPVVEILNTESEALEQPLSKLYLTITTLKTPPDPPKLDLEYMKELRDFQRAVNADYESANKQLEEKARGNTVTVTGALALAALIVKPDVLVKGLDHPKLEQIGALGAIGLAALVIVIIFVQNTAVQRPTDSKLADPEWIYEKLPIEASDRATLLRTQQLVYRDYAVQASGANLQKARTLRHQFRLVIGVFILILVYFGISLYYQATFQSLTVPTVSAPQQSPPINPWKTLK